MKRALVLLTIVLPACGGSSGGSSATPSSPSTSSGPTTLVGRSVESDAQVGSAVVSGTEVTITAAGYYTLQTSLSLHANGVAYLRPVDGDMSTAAVSPFVFWNGGRSVGWPASTTTLTWVPESTVSGDSTALATIDAGLSKLNSYGFGNVGGSRVTFARATSATGAVCAVRVDPNDADIVSNGLPGWTRYTLSAGVITSCVTIFRTIADARNQNLVLHEMIHGIGLGHTSTSVSGTNLMNPTINTDTALFSSLARVVSTNIAMAFRRRPNTALSGSTEDERGASSAGAGIQIVGLP